MKWKLEKAVNDVSKIDRVRDIHEEDPGLNAAQVGKRLANDFGLNITPSTVRKMLSDVKGGVDIILKRLF